ncbi:MAG: ribosomal protein S18-alanine N-acetyltransferase [Polyangiaceae bacterium]
MSPEIMLVRACEPSLLAALSRLAEEAFPGQPFSMEEEVARPWTRLWVASVSADPAAFLVGWHVADELHILNVATSPNMRRRGLGDAILAAVLDYAKAQHIRIVLLEVRRSNDPAIGLYRKHGFSVFGVRKKYYSDNDEDAIEMALSLDPETGAIQPRADEPH